MTWQRKQIRVVPVNLFLRTDILEKA